MQLVEAAEKQQLQIDSAKLDSLTSAAESASGPEAVRGFARCIRFLMDELRNQSGR